MHALTVGSVVARKGQSVSGFIEVPAGVDQASNIPVTVVTGARDGPVLALTAFAAILTLLLFAWSRRDGASTAPGPDRTAEPTAAPV